ncbi:Crp/Fnr family transcriptional regulator [Afifella sp. IM 167]|uniref:Crp/Fnr family transcriptional regulator n=1 Tax=Afifella sp. IM 167 TaxID=2033586 RepID=UPI001CCD6498|nr:Crp/Fnr family transcriptional regulator [Afifella sp. IM 167]
MPGLDRSLIAGLDAFEGLGPRELDHILAGARSARYARDAAIFEEGAEATTFFFLLDGHVRVVRTTPDGQQVIARYIDAGELFGIAAAIGRNTYPASAIAAVDCVALVWPTGLWADLSSRFPIFAGNAHKTVGKRLLETQSRMMELATQQVEQRVAHALLRLVRQSGRKVEEGIEIDFPISRQDIAEMTGTTLHTVSRLLSGWESEGLVRSGRQKVTVTDPHGLLLVADGHRRK